MDLSNEFTVTVPVEQAWAVLTDVARVAPCIPGAELQDVVEDEYRGVVKLKVGPVTAQYRGTARFLEQDAVTHRAVLRAEGRETRGQGNASATIVASLSPEGSGTRVAIATDLTVTGRVAQFGRGVLAEVSNKLIGQFVESLESTVLSASVPAPGGAMPRAGAQSATATSSEGREGGSAAPEGPGEEAAISFDPVHLDGARASTASAASERGVDTEAVNVVSLVLPALLRRALPVVALTAVGAVILQWWRRRARP